MTDNELLHAKVDASIALIGLIPAFISAQGNKKMTRDEVLKAWKKEVNLLEETIKKYEEYHNNTSDI